MRYLKLLIAVIALCGGFGSVSAYAEEREERFLHHILVEQEATANRLHQELQAAGIERRRSVFAALARQHSKDPGSGPNGGELGWATRGTYVPEIEAAADRLGIEQFSAPVKTVFGWHLVMLTDKRYVQGAPPNLKTESDDDAIPSLLRRLRSKLTERWELVVTSDLGLTHVDTQSIARVGNKSKGWFLQTRLKPGQSDLPGRKFKSLKILYVASCTERSFAQLQWIEYEDEFGGGESLGSQSYRDEPSRYTSPAPESVGEEMLARLCKAASNPRKP